MDTSATFNKIIKSLQRLFGFHSGFSNYDYLHAFGKASNALLYSVLFLPELVEIGSSVFLKINIENERSFHDLLDKLKQQKTISEIEVSYNFIEIGYLFDCNGRDLLDDEDVLLANRIRDSCEGWLKIQYPQRKFIVEVVQPETAVDAIRVQFYENR